MNEPIEGDGAPKAGHPGQWRRKPDVIEGEVLRVEDAPVTLADTPLAAEEDAASAQTSVQDGAQASGSGAAAPDVAEHAVENAGGAPPYNRESMADAVGETQSAAAEPLADEPALPTPPAPRPSRLPLAALLLSLLALAAAGADFAQRLAQERGGPPPDRQARDGLAALQARVQTLEARPIAVPAPPPAPVPAPPPLAPSVSPQQLAALDSRVAALEGTVKGVGAAIEQFKAAQATAQTQAAGAKPVDLGPIDKRIATLEAMATAPKVADRATETAIEKSTGSANAAGLAVVAQRIGDAIARGIPFANELAAAETLGASAARVAALKPASEKGVASVDVLRSQFAALSPSLLADTGAPPRGEGVWQRIVAGAGGLVRVRRVGETAGSDTPSVVSRIDGALQRADVAGALTQWESLPADAQAKSKALADAARARLDAGAAARALGDEALAALAKPKT